MENAASRFGQHLAHTEKKYRDRALKKLTVYLTAKREWSELEWDKLWKALFYCMWMSDKRPVQEELSSNLAALVHRMPSTDAALQFFVRETVALLRAQQWDKTWLCAFVTMLSTEIVSQLPNGLRLHLADVYLAEIYTASGNDITTEAFVTLLEPFYTLLSSEYDKMVFKRVRESVFEDLLTKYKCRPELKKEKDDDREETDEEEGDDDEIKTFGHVDVAKVQHRIFVIASADETAERNRPALYTLYKKFFSATQVDSFQVAQEEASQSKKSVSKGKKEEAVKPHVLGNTNENLEIEKTGGEDRKKAKKSRKRKTKEEAEADADAKTVVKARVKQLEVAESGETQDELSATKVKKQKYTTEVKVEEKAVDSPREGTKQKHAAEVKVEDAPTATATGKSKKRQTKQEAKKAENKIVAEEPVIIARGKSLKDETKEKSGKKEEVFVTKSGKKLRRCGSCGGFGKDLVPKDKVRCGHCERTQKTGRKKAALALKKRKVESQAWVAREEQEKVELSKKVTFGKSKVLRHEVSIKRLKASAKRDVVSKDMDEVKSVLKVTIPSPVASKKLKKTSTSTSRKTAAHFF
ncbi:unnamed protein product [Hyaloperonospora brassicae]|uniref:Ribosomal RNA processing protein 1 n=1 Tax=Hyaloperonospora brassicae TaxID=162125 RepID=A0AAV0TKN9_HYABA|nr:unnamed protein product [Hyaloperonospora brassicae]